MPENGSVLISNLAGGAGAPTFFFFVYDKYRIGGFSVGSDRTFEYTMPPLPGDWAPDFKMVDVFTKEERYLSDLGGHVLLVDFWASWCRPCFTPMTKASEMLKRRAEDWRGRVGILAVSIDDEIDGLEKFVRDRGWENIGHHWSGGEGRKWLSDAAKAYRLGSGPEIPAAFLINGEGVIVWNGHPTDKDANLEARIDELLKD